MHAHLLILIVALAAAPVFAGAPCAHGGDAALERGVELFEAGDYAQAVPQLECARRLSQDRSAVLLLGISHYELGDDVRAVPLLEDAAKDPELADSAHVFLALAAWRGGNTDGAARHFDRAAQGGNPEIAATATDLARMARTDGRFVVSASALAAYDSNVGLTPAGMNAARTGPDAAMVVAASVFFRPAAAPGPFLKTVVHYRDQLTLDAFDFGGVTAGAGWDFGAGSVRGSAEYGFDFMLLGREPLETAHELAAELSWLPSALGLRGRWTGRLDQWSSPSLAGYSGLLNRGEAAVAWASASVRLSAGWRAEHAGLADPALSFVGHGPTADGELTMGGGLVRLRGSATWSARTHAAAADGVRQDQLLEVRSSAGVALGNSWMLEAGVAYARSQSNVARYQWANVSGQVGISWVGAPL